MSEDNAASDATSYDSTSTGSTVSMSLSQLSCPVISSLARKRKVPSNLSTRGKRKNTEPKSILPNERVEQYPDEHFVAISNESLFCMACREPISLKKSVINLHVKSVKHHNEKMQLQFREEHERGISNMIQQYDQITYPVGKNLPAEVCIQRR